MIKTLDWNKMNDLMPAIIQHASSGQVLMLGYMNQDALEQTKEKRQVTFYSRSKQRLWVKGETSGDYLNVVSIQPDCDGDALLIHAMPEGPTCHKGSVSCFYSKESCSFNFLLTLERIIQERVSGDNETSYTKNLFNSGMKRMAQKVGEEGVEVALAAVSQNHDELIEESADLIFHLLVLLQANSLDLTDIIKVLESRVNTS